MRTCQNSRVVLTIRTHATHEFWLSPQFYSQMFLSCSRARASTVISSANGCKGHSMVPRRDGAGWRIRAEDGGWVPGFAASQRAYITYTITRILMSECLTDFPICRPPLQNLVGHGTEAKQNSVQIYLVRRSTYLYICTQQYLVSEK